jgi:hypothetical protein
MGEHVKGNMLFFDAPTHKYTDEVGNPYVSTTTLIGHYYEKFDTKKMARLCELAGRRGDPKYRGKTAAMLELEWTHESDSACEYGSVKHDFLEQAVKNSTGYRLNITKEFSGNRLLTVPDVIEHPGFGELSLNYFRQTKIDILYPDIFQLLVELTSKGYRIYAEIGIHYKERLVSGLIDLFLIRDKEFVILDWKTNKYDFTYVAGYWEKNEHKEVIGFVETNKTFFRPLHNLTDSVGNKYALQLSTYAYLVERLGLKLNGIVLCHIRHEQYIHPIIKKLVDKVEFIKMPYLRKEVIAMIEDNWNKNIGKTSKLIRV